MVWRGWKGKAPIPPNEGYGSPRKRSKSFLEMLAGFPQTPKRFFFACGAPANVPTFFFRFAGFPQTPKSSFFDLRDSRKRQNVLFSICGTSANVKTSSFRFAELPQAPKRPLFDLRNFRKHQNVLFLICGTSANVFQSAASLLTNHHTE